MLFIMFLSPFSISFPLLVLSLVTNVFPLFLSFELFSVSYRVQPRPSVCPQGWNNLSEPCRLISDYKMSYHMSPYPRICQFAYRTAVRLRAQNKVEVESLEKTPPLLMQTCSQCLNVLTLPSSQGLDGILPQNSETVYFLNFNSGIHVF